MPEKEAFSEATDQSCVCLASRLCHMPPSTTTDGGRPGNECDTQKRRARNGLGAVVDKASRAELSLSSELGEDTVSWSGGRAAVTQRASRARMLCDSRAAWVQSWDQH